MFAKGSRCLSRLPAAPDALVHSVLASKTVIHVLVADSNCSSLDTYE